MASSFEIMLPIFVTTLGPLKVIPVFYSMTQNASFRYRAELALRAAKLRPKPPPERSISL